MDQFTLRIDLRAFSPEARADVKVLISTTPKRVPIPGIGLLETVTPRSTNAEGRVDFELVSLPGLTYHVAIGSDDPISIPGDQPVGTIVRLDTITSAVASPIVPVDAAALRAELIALIEASAGSGGGGGGGTSSTIPDLIDHGLIQNNGTYFEIGIDAGHSHLFNVEYGASINLVFTEPVEQPDGTQRWIVISGYPSDFQYTLNGTSGSNGLGAQVFTKAAGRWLRDSAGVPALPINLLNVPPVTFSDEDLTYTIPDTSEFLYRDDYGVINGGGWIAAGTYPVDGYDNEQGGYARIQATPSVSVPDSWMKEEGIFSWYYNPGLGVPL